MTSTISLFGVEELQHLEYESDKNLIQLYKEELSRIDKGLNFKLHKCDKRLLFKRGFINYNHCIKRFVLTERAHRILNSL